MAKIKLERHQCFLDKQACGRLEHHRVIDQIRGLVFHQNQFGHVLSRLLREPLFPHNRHRLWTSEDRHKLSSGKISSFSLIGSAHGLKIFLRDDTFHSVREVSGVLFMVDRCLSLHQIIHNWISHSQNLPIRFFRQCHSPSRCDSEHLVKPQVSSIMTSWTGLPLVSLS